MRIIARSYLRAILFEMGISYEISANLKELSAQMERDHGI